MNTIIEQLSSNIETYTEIQAQEAFDLARTSRGVIYAEELYTVGRLGEGRVQMRALENKVMEVKNRVRIADLQLMFLRQKLEAGGFVLSDDSPQDFVERLREKPLLHAQLTASELERVSLLPMTADAPTETILQEPISRPDVSGWMLATLSGEPDVDISEDESSNASEGNKSTSVPGNTKIWSGTIYHLLANFIIS